MKFLYLILCLIVTVGCDRSSVKIPNNQGNYKVINNEGTLIGEGVLTVKNVKIVVKNTKIYVSNVNYGSIPVDAETILHVYDDGSFLVTVNGERRHPVVKKENARSNMGLKFN